KLLISAILIHFRLWTTVSRLYKATISKIGAVANRRRDRERESGRAGERESGFFCIPLSLCPSAPPPLCLFVPMSLRPSVSPPLPLPPAPPLPSLLKARHKKRAPQPPVTTPRRFRAGRYICQTSRGAK